MLPGGVGGWITPSDAELIDTALPEPHVGLYLDGDGAPAGGMEAGRTLRGAGHVESHAVSSGAGIRATVEMHEAYGVILLDTLILPPPWAACGPPPAGAWEGCQ